MPQASIIIPVFNNWLFTCKCLESIAKNTNTAQVEVIVVDNASTDETEAQCPALGRKLFGDAFVYARNAENRNFAGACNQGAHMAKGEYLVFLNNDTEVEPGWLPPLLADFDKYPGIAATGPLLVYPDETPLGRLVQHLGVFITPSRSVGHLYQLIPVSSPLARKRRFFQVITAACMVIKRSLFLANNGFDEHLINGYEDFDLCARLVAQGYRMTVNPDAVVIHHESKTPGRYKHDKANSDYVQSKAARLVAPDWEKLVNADGIDLGITDWLDYRPLIKRGGERAKVAAALENCDLDIARAMINGHPLCKAAWAKYFELAPHDKNSLIIAYVRLFFTPELAWEGMQWAVENNDINFFRYCEAKFLEFAKSTQGYLKAAKDAEAWFKKLGMADFASLFSGWIANYSNFVKGPYARFRQVFRQYAEAKGLPLEDNGEGWNPAPALAGCDFRAADYLRLYPEVGESGMDPYFHYLSVGISDGRKGRCSNIDYAAITPDSIAKWKAAPKNGVILCTAICGDEYRLLPPACLMDGWQYVCFCDRPADGYGIWDIRPIKDAAKGAQWVKMNSPFLLRDARKIIWTDANIVIAGDISNRLGPGEMSMAKPIRGGVVYQQAEKEKCDEELIKKQMDTYRQKGLPEETPVYETDFFLIDPRVKLVQGIFRQWQVEFNKYGCDDRLSLPYAFFRNNFQPKPLLPDGHNARNWPALHYLTPAETHWIELPDFLRQKP